MTLKMPGLAMLIAAALSLSGCQNLPMGLPNPIAPGVTAESCKQTLEEYMTKVSKNPEKYQNVTAYPEIEQYSKTLNECQVKGFLQPEAIMKVMENVSTASMSPEEAAEAKKAFEEAREATKHLQDSGMDIHAENSDVE